jgi:hypothetical protein
LKVIAKRLFAENIDERKTGNWAEKINKCLSFLIALTIIPITIASLAKLWSSNLLTHPKFWFLEFIERGNIYFYDNTLNINNFLFFITSVLFTLVIIKFWKKLIAYMSPDSITRELEKLNNRLHAASQSLERGGEFNPSQVAKLAFKMSNTYGPVDFRELEDSLISILAQLAKKKKNYIFILDELDKLDNITAKDKSKDIGLSFADRTRQRQKAVKEVLLNLKYFLNHANAKFVFIAGRELYDADLADVADRDFFWGSIFHDVIYVETLIKAVHQNREQPQPQMGDSFASSSPSYFIEQFLCQYLLPSNLSKESPNQPLENILTGNGYNLRTLSGYLEKKVSYGSTKYNKYDKEVLKNKIIFLLEDFIVYLTYRSAGLPMKLNKLFEDYIVLLDKNSVNDYSKNAIVAYSEDNWQDQEQQRYFLRFTYDQQYEVGFLANLYRPFLTKYAMSMSHLDDKVLLSIPFLMDHFLKYHEAGFSWRNLEQIPELLELNRAPSLRRFITNLDYFTLGFINHSLMRLRFCPKYPTCHLRPSILR